MGETSADEVALLQRLALQCAADRPGVAPESDETQQRFDEAAFVSLNDREQRSFSPTTRSRPSSGWQ